MKGRILTDVPQTGHKAGDYADLDEKTARALVEAGAFDPMAPWPGADKTPRQPRRAQKRKDES